MGMVVSKERKSGHLSAVLKQGAASKRARLSPYGQSLFDSCFKKWTVTNLEEN
ncbi:hypothetical protein H7992_04910 [Sporosarcina sp. resist]|uniref:hypothetical protein n=1 Tax=Sporosarcina sp. resist TaxID=2762563 RepID=UPI00164EB455|nr:hypothetical protein [Sporosarcina sp. resist]QNK89068.1 hypothetical protein H7992_04910 [Sporosarcina sp. resist]